MRGRPQDGSRLAFLNDLSGIHDRDALAHVRDDTEVVRDDQKAHSSLPPQSLEKFEDARLHEDVDRACGLICEQQLGPEGERHGDEDALTHPTAQLMWVTACLPSWVADTYAPERLDRLL